MLFSNFLVYFKRLYDNILSFKIFKNKISHNTGVSAHFFLMTEREWKKRKKKEEKNVE